MDQSALLSIVQTIFAALNCKEVWSRWNDKSDLDELKEVVLTINNVLQDAEANNRYGQFSTKTQKSIQKLITSLNYAEILMAEFLTLAQKMDLLNKDEFIREVLFFFLQNKSHRVAFTMSNVFRNILNNLDGIDIVFDETYSYGNPEIVEQIVHQLLHSDVSPLTIVGMGGIGKTTLVQLAFHDEEIKSQFDLRSWVYVSYEDQSSLDVKAILAQIYESATGQKSDDCSMDVVVNRVREVLLGKQFLIVLDDLWIESPDELQKLLVHLDGGKAGSKIMVTTRSLETAKMMGIISSKYLLQGLSHMDSWDLFRRTALDMIDHEIPKGSYMDKLIIGKDIIKFCVNVPLALRQIGSLLDRQDISKWEQLQKDVLTNYSEYENSLQPILKFCYDDLESPLKSCFSYCSVFPKGFRINKKMLVKLWKAQGYVVPLRKGQSVEDASEEYISVLLQRGFFKDAMGNKFGEIYSFKLHDLLHDLAFVASEKEIRQASCYTRDLLNRVSLVSLIKQQYVSFGSVNANIQTFLAAILESEFGEPSERSTTRKAVL